MFGKVSEDLPPPTRLRGFEDSNDPGALRGLYIGRGWMISDNDRIQWTPLHEQQSTSKIVDVFQIRLGAH